MTLLGETAHVIAGNGFHKLVHRAESCRGINALLGLGDEASRFRSRVLGSRSQRLENRADRRGVGSSGKLARWIPLFQFTTKSKLSIFDSMRRSISRSGHNQSRIGTVAATDDNAGNAEFYVRKRPDDPY